LAIVRELVRALGGRVDVASSVGEGTTFRVTLPRSRD
jgi:signal transduction histidine kinase